MSSLSTHVLDTTHGRPARGMRLWLYHGDTALHSGTTDADGRCPALPALALTPGRYRLLFAVADYFRTLGLELPEPPFLDQVALDFGIGDGHHHVPLLVAPFAYSTYRGS